jgi:uncharacterized protein
MAMAAGPYLRGIDRHAGGATVAARCASGTGSSTPGSTHLRGGNGSMASDTYHEPFDQLSDETRDMHRAILSLMEELEAVDWYNQRVDACHDPELSAILVHNRDEEKEHAAMTLEWIRRRDPKFDAELREVLFRDGPIVRAHEPD